MRKAAGLAPVREIARALRIAASLALTFLAALAAVPTPARADVAVTLGALPCAHTDRVAGELEALLRKAIEPGDDLHVYAAAVGDGTLELALAHRDRQQQRRLRFTAEDCPELAQAVAYLVEAWVHSGFHTGGENIGEGGGDGVARPASGAAEPAASSGDGAANARLRRAPLIGRWRRELEEEQQVPTPALRLQLQAGGFAAASATPAGSDRVSGLLAFGAEWDRSDRFGLGLRASWDAPLRLPLAQGSMDASLWTLALLGRYSFRSAGGGGEGGGRIDLLAGPGVQWLRVQPRGAYFPVASVPPDLSLEAAVRWRRPLTRGFAASVLAGLRVRRVAERLVATGPDGVEVGSAVLSPLRFFVAAGLDWTAFWEDPHPRDIQ